MSVRLAEVALRLPLVCASRSSKRNLIPEFAHQRNSNSTLTEIKMLPPPSLTVVQMLAAENAVAQAAEIPCTCGAKDWHKQHKKSNTKPSSIEAKQATNDPIADTPKLHRSLWRKLLGKGPKCVCQKRRTVTSKPGLIEIPAEYVGCSAVTVSGKRVPFSRDMQQQCRKSWMPLHAIEEDE